MTTEIEEIAVQSVHEMAIESLDPETFQKWEDVMAVLRANRNMPAELGVSVPAETGRIEPVFVIFDGPPDHEAPAFVEVETADGHSIQAGEWVKYPATIVMHEGLWRLGPFYLSPPLPTKEGWQPIETAPKDGRKLLLGYFNSSGKWRTLRGQWFSLEHIASEWEEPEDADEGWYETPVEVDDIPNVWATTPTHWMPLPAAPKP